MLFFQEKFQIFEAGTEFACLDAVDEVDPASFAGYITSLCFNYFCTTVL